MGFIASSGQLLRHLKALSGAISSNPIVPILENFQLEVGKGVLRTTASDLQTTIVAEMPVETSKEAHLCVPARILIETLSNLADQPVTFTIDEDTYGLNIKTETGRYRIAGESAADFPRLPKMASTASLELSGAVLQRAISTTVFAASAEDQRPAMQGVYFHLDTDSSTFVATDGHRLVRYSRTDIQVETETSFIMPRKALLFLKNALPMDQTVVTMAYNAMHTSFSFGSTQIFCRLVDERFPDYQGAIPVQNPNQLIIERLDLLTALKRISIYTSKNSNQVRLKFAASELTLIAEDQDYSNEGTERLPCDYTGDPMEIGFNARMMVELLSNISTNLVSLELSAPNRPGILTPRTQEEHETVLMLAMPIMLSSYVPV